MRKLYFRIVVYLIKKYFKEGLSTVADDEDRVIAYHWIWTKNAEDEAKEKRRHKYYELRYRECNITPWHIRTYKFKFMANIRAYILEHSRWDDTFMYVISEGTKTKIR